MKNINIKKLFMCLLSLVILLATVFPCLAFADNISSSVTLSDTVNYSTVTSADGYKSYTYVFQLDGLSELCSVSNFSASFSYYASGVWNSTGVISALSINPVSSTIGITNITISENQISIVAACGTYSGNIKGFSITINFNESQVIFENEGNIVNTVTVLTGNTIQPIELTKEHYTFNGWYTESSGGTFIEFPYIVAADTTLYAQWTINSYTVMFDLQGSIINSQTVDYGAIITDAPETARSGYTFDGWYTESSGGTLIEFPYTVTSDITLYAQWIKIQATSENDDMTVFNLIFLIIGLLLLTLLVIIPTRKRR